MLITELARGLHPATERALGQLAQEGADHAEVSGPLGPVVGVEALQAALANFKPQPGDVPFFSTVTGVRCTGEGCDAGYWARGIREPVRFASAVDALAEFGVAGDEAMESPAPGNTIAQGCSELLEF